MLQVHRSFALNMSIPLSVSPDGQQELQTRYKGS